MPSTAYIGIDPSLNGTGICAINGQGDLIDSAVFLTPPLLRRKTSRTQRLVWLAREAMAFIARIRSSHTIMYGAIESGSYASNGQIFSLGEASGVLRFTLAAAHVSHILVPPMSAKKLFAGKGNAGKADMVAAAYSHCGKVLSSDEADAFGLAYVAMLAWLNEDLRAKFTPQVLPETRPE